MVLIFFSTGFHINRKMINSFLVIPWKKHHQLPQFSFRQNNIFKSPIQTEFFFQSGSIALTLISMILFSLIYLSITSIQILAVRTSIFLRSGLPVSCNPDFQFLAVWISSFWRSRSKVSYWLSSAPFHKIFHVYDRRTIIPLPIPFDQSNAMHTVKLIKKLCHCRMRHSQQLLQFCNRVNNIDITITVNPAIFLG